MSKNNAKNLKKSDKNASSKCSKCFYWIKTSGGNGWCRNYDFEVSGDMLSDGFLESSFQDDQYDKVDVIRDYKNTGHSSQVELYHPVSYIPKPTREDYDNTLLKRYFCKYRNDNRNKIKEISEDDYKKINVQYYKSIEVLWRISGPAEDIVTDGFVTSKGIANSNRDTIKLKDKELSGLHEYLSDLSELAYVKGETLDDAILDIPAESVFGSGKAPGHTTVMGNLPTMDPKVTEE